MSLRLYQVVSISQQEAQRSPHTGLSKYKQHIKNTAEKEVRPKRQTNKGLKEPKLLHHLKYFRNP